MTVSSEQLVPRAQAGDPLATDALVRRYTGMAYAVARGYFLAGGDRSDLHQEALVGLWKAIRDFDSTHGVAFGSFASLCIQRQVITAIKTATREKHQPLNTATMFSRPVNGFDGDHMEFGDLFEDNRLRDPFLMLVERDEFRALVRFLATYLSPLELETVRGHVNGESYAEMERRLGISDLGPNEKAKVVDNATQRVRVKAKRFLRERAVLGEVAAARPDEAVRIASSPSLADLDAEAA